MTLEKRIFQMESQLQARQTLDEEIQALLDEFSPEEQHELIENFIRTHTFFDPSRLTDEERARNVFLAGGTKRLEADDSPGDGWRKNT